MPDHVFPGWEVRTGAFAHMLMRGERMNETILKLEGTQEEENRPETLCRIPLRQKRNIPMHVRLAVSLALCVALVLCRIAWPGRATTLRRWIVGDGSEQIQQAFFSMEQSLEEGEGLGEAWSAFCAKLTDEPA